MSNRKVEVVLRGLRVALARGARHKYIPVGSTAAIHGR